MNVLSIQSWVAYGHVGNSAALFPLQRLGAEVTAVNTVQFSNHTGYGRWTGQVFSAAAIRDVLDGVFARGFAARCDAVLSGYLGDAETGEAILDAAVRVRQANPRAVWCCDPVIGDEGRVYVRPGIMEFLRDRALPAADIATPNQFELELLTGDRCATLADARRAAAALSARGPRTILVTSLRVAETPADSVEMLALEGGIGHRVRTPLLPGYFSGAGDLTAALFLFYRHSADTPTALARAAAAVHAVLRATVDSGGVELALVAAQDELTAPRKMFALEPC